jgi:hypothetical protein
MALTLRAGRVQKMESSIWAALVLKENKYWSQHLIWTLGEGWDMTRSNWENGWCWWNHWKTRRWSHCETCSTEAKEGTMMKRKWKIWDYLKHKIKKYINIRKKESKMETKSFYWSLDKDHWKWRVEEKGVGSKSRMKERKRGGGGGEGKDQPSFAC